MTIQGIFFDLDETLIVDDAVVEASMRAVAERAQGIVRIDAERLASDARAHATRLWAQGPAIEYAQQIGISATEGLWAQFSGHQPDLVTLREWSPSYRCAVWLEALRAQHVDDENLANLLAADFPVERRSRHTVYPDAESVLNDLRGRYRLALITNGAPDLQREKIEACGLSPYFDVILVSGEEGVGKPDPRLFEIALANLGLQHHQIVMVGDKLSRDIAGAHASGLYGVWINRSRDDAVPEPEPWATITTLRELPEVLDRLDQCDE